MFFSSNSFFPGLVLYLYAKYNNKVEINSNNKPALNNKVCLFCFFVLHIFKVSDKKYFVPGSVSCGFIPLYFIVKISKNIILIII